MCAARACVCARMSVRMGNHGRWLGPGGRNGILYTFLYYITTLREREAERKCFTSSLSKDVPRGARFVNYDVLHNNNSGITLGVTTYCWLGILL